VGHSDKFTLFCICIIIGLFAFEVCVIIIIHGVISLDRGWLSPLSVALLISCFTLGGGVEWVLVHNYWGRYWPVAPAPDDGWWVWSSGWNSQQGIPKYWEKTCPSATLSTINPTWPEPGSNPYRRCGKPATDRQQRQLFANQYTRQQASWDRSAGSAFNSMAWVREWTISIERPPLVGEVSANFCG
jgi:hypothetical protein